MSMLYLALIAGSLFYLSRIILEFRAYEMSVLPEMENSEKKIDRLENLIESEVHKLADVKQRVASVRGVREDLMREVEDINGKLLAEQTHYQALFLDLQKRQFRGALARGRKLVLR
jgi:chromosome segregation ATPase